MNKQRGSKDSQETKRRLVVKFLQEKKGNHRQAGELFALSKSAVDKIWTRFKENGSQGLLSKKRGVQGGKKINGKQAAEIRTLINDKLPDQLKLPFGLWTREAVLQMIRKKYDIKLSRWQVGRYLKTWGYTPQKPISKAFDQKQGKMREWLKKEYPAIKKRVAKENGIFYFGDETGLRSGQQTGAGYLPAGETRAIKKTDQDFSLNMISAISNRNHLQFMMLDGRFTGEVFQTFIQQMIKHSKQKIFFVTDGHTAHKNRKLNEWLAQRSKRVEVIFLPSYNSD